jgi:hypothetical protein
VYVRRHDTQHNDTQHDNTQHNDIQLNDKCNTTMSIITVNIMAELSCAKCDLCWLSLMLSVTCKPFMLSVTCKPFLPSVIMLIVVRLNVIMLSVVKLNVIMLNVMAPHFMISMDQPCKKVTHGLPMFLHDRKLHFIFKERKKKSFILSWPKSVTRLSKIDQRALDTNAGKQQS